MKVSMYGYTTCSSACPCAAMWSTRNRTWRIASRTCASLSVSISSVSARISLSRWRRDRASPLKGPFAVLTVVAFGSAVATGFMAYLLGGPRTNPESQRHAGCARAIRPRPGLPGEELVGSKVASDSVRPTEHQEDVDDD